MQKRIINNVSESFKPLENGHRSNPIAAYLSAYVADELTRRFREAANDSDAIVLADFTFEESGGQVESMCLSFNVRSWGRDILEDMQFFSIFQKVVRSTISRRILLEHKPNNGFGLAEYCACDYYSMISLLEAIQRTGCETKSTFRILPDEATTEDDRKARIGFFGCGFESKYEVYVRTDDECQVPHVHVRDEFDPKHEAIVTLHRACYYPHGGFNGKLDEDDLKCLADFMSQPYRSPRFANNYEFAVTMWNCNNRTQYKCGTDDDGQVLIPDYAHTADLDGRDKALSQGLHLQFDNLYIARMNNEIKNRSWR
jgi:hypothetical protein